MAQSDFSFALAGLLHEILEQFPNLVDQLPEWLIQARKDALPAIAWANRLLTHEPSQTLWQQHPQRATIFKQLFLNTESPVHANRFIPIKPLELTEQVVLPQAAAAADERAAAYEALLQEMEAGLAALRPFPPPAYLTAAYDWLQRFAWCLPSPYGGGGETAVSLFDHSRALAALLPCYRSGAAETADAPVAAFISGDISGVQSFIYTITARGATSGLRGRSLYLQLLTEAISGYVLRALQLPSASLIYAGGGHFFLIAPPDKAGQLPEVQRHVSDALLRHHQGELYLALGSAAFTAADFRPDQFGKAWSRLSQSVSRAKRRRFSELGETMFADIFTEQGLGGLKQGECRVCHYEGEVESDPDKLDEEGDQITKCFLCQSLETLGQELRQAQGLLLSQIAPQTHARQKWLDALAEFGLHVAVITNEANLLETAAGKEETRYLAINDNAARQARAALAATPTPVLLRYMVNVTPLVTEEDEKESKETRVQFRQKHPHAPQEKWPELWREGFVRPFELIESHACGLKRLGVLRMDVDDLGRIFAEGFGSQGGLAQTAALSFAMSLFFEGWVAGLARRADAGRNVVYSIYSGGDDLFIVGAWDVLPDLAHSIAQDLRRYAAHNPHIHVSAGITLHGGKYPLYQAARAAEDALERAKDFSQSGASKNAFTFLGRTLSWEEYADLQTSFAELAKLVAPQDKDAPKAPQRLLQLLIQMEALYTQHRRYQLASGQEAQKVYWGPWHWRSAYLLNRLAKQNKDVKDNVLGIAAQLSGDHFSRIALLGLAARWAELQTREDHKNKEAVNGRE